MKKIYEAHEVEDITSGEPRYCGTTTNYEDAKADYDAIVADGGFARLLEVDEDGMPIRELECNYTQDDINEVLRRNR